MSADINPEALRRSEALHRLADALTDDILAAPAQTLLAEVAADHGDDRAFAKAFDRILGRAARQSTWQRSVDWSSEFFAKTLRVASLKPVIAGIGVLLIIVVAGDIFVRLQSGDGGQTIASATGDRTTKMRSPDTREDRLAPSGAQSDRFRNSSVPASQPAQPAPSATNAAPVSPSDDIPDYGDPKSVRTVTVRPDLPERSGLSAAGAAPPPQAARPSPQGPAAVGQPLSKLEQAPAAARAVSGSPNVASAPPQPNAFAAAPAAAPSEAAAVPLFDWPVRGRVIARFGPIPGNLRNDGINIAVPEGTDVHAADDGVVVYAGNDVKGYGNLVLMRHGNGFVTAYAHASQLLVSTGDTIQRGQVIAKSGRTGQAREPQVHFEIRKGTMPVDPLQYLSPG
jgi:murein DD-endopeptidase MepM/ murein hydrolase activator NlpD